MRNGWDTVKLGELLTKSEECISINDDKNYREVTVRLWGKGVIQRREVIGSEIAASSRIIVRSEQFILSRIDARNGAFGLIPEFLDGAVVTNDFPVFTLNRKKILPAYMAWLSRTHRFIDICKAASEGTTNRVRLKEKRFLDTEINIPTIYVQKRIVSWIDELSSKIREAKALRDDITTYFETFLLKTFIQAFDKYADSTVLIGDAFKVTTGGTPARNRAEYWDGDIKSV